MPTITLDDDSDGVATPSTDRPPPRDSRIAARIESHGGRAQSPQEAPQAFADAVIEVAGNAMSERSARPTRRPVAPYRPARREPSRRRR